MSHLLQTTSCYSVLYVERFICRTFMDKRGFWKEAWFFHYCSGLQALSVGFTRGNRVWGLSWRCARWWDWKKVKGSGMGNTVLNQKHFKKWLFSDISISLRAWLGCCPICVFEARKSHLLRFCVFWPYSMLSPILSTMEPLGVQLCLTVLLSTVSNRGLCAVSKGPMDVSEHTPDSPCLGALWPSFDLCCWRPWEEIPQNADITWHWHN